MAPYHMDALKTPRDAVNIDIMFTNIVNASAANSHPFPLVI